VQWSDSVAHNTHTALQNILVHLVSIHRIIVVPQQMHIQAKAVERYQDCACITGAFGACIGSFEALEGSCQAELHTALQCM
jgi:hypothetical protein